MPNSAQYIHQADRYFRYLATCFPVMCASDEFHFLPRAQAAAEFYSQLDNLDSHKLDSIITDLKSFQEEFSRLAARIDDLEYLIDLELIKSNISGILIELELKQSWRYNPLLYLKIAFIGVEHAWDKPAFDSIERVDRALSRLSAIPRLLRQASQNIDSVPQSYHEAARSMLRDCQRYLNRIAKQWPADEPGIDVEKFFSYLQAAAAELRVVDVHLSTVSVEPDERFATETLNETLQHHFLSRRDVNDIFQLAAEDWELILAFLDKLKRKINSTSTWQELYHGYLPGEIDDDDTLCLYRDEIERLRRFFGQRGFHPQDLNQPVEVAVTPVYLQSVRGAASFAAAYSNDPQEKSYFYITTQLPGFRNKTADLLLKKRFHREFKMLTAHETIPGHHFLDSIRRRLQNPIRRQIESPLFYEGWASYSEGLLVDTGYIHAPMDLLVDYKRRLWRSARCQVDVGLATGKIKLADALKLLETCGFTTNEARRQIDRFRLNPGYQLCYSLGCYEFNQLKNTYGSILGEADFYAFLLEGGELPFHLIQKRLDKYCTHRNR